MRARSSFVRLALPALLSLALAPVLAQSTYTHFAMNQDGGLVQGMAVAKASEDGLLMGTINDGMCNIVRMDSTGAILWSTSIAIDSGATFLDIANIAEINDGPECYIMAIRSGYQQTDFYNPRVLVELDSAHEIVFSKQYYDVEGRCNWSGTSYYQGKAYRDSSGTYVISIPTGDGSCLYELDAVGDTLHTIVISNLFGGGANVGGVGSYELRDGSFLLLNNLGNGHYLHMMRTSGSGVILWSKYYPTGNFSDIPFAAVQTPDDSVVVVGIHALDQAYHWGFIMKMDTLGNIGWHRRYDLDDGAFIASGFPKRIALAPNGDILVWLAGPSSNMVVHFNSTGMIQAWKELLIPEFPWTGKYDDIEVLFSDQGEMTIVGSVLYGGAPYWNDSLTVCRVSDLDQIQCYSQPWSWFEEPYPDTLVPIDNIVHSFWSPWFRTDDVPCTVGPATWVVEPYCLSTAQTEQEESPQMLLYPNVTTRGMHARLLFTGTASQEVQVIALDGSLEDIVTVRSSAGECTIPTDALSPGMYVVRALTDEGVALSARLVVTDR